jgi:hypothetical protein
MRGRAVPTTRFPIKLSTTLSSRFPSLSLSRALSLYLPCCCCCCGGGGGVSRPEHREAAGVAVGVAPITHGPDLTAREKACRWHSSLARLTHSVSARPVCRGDLSKRLRTGSMGGRGSW